MRAGRRVTAVLVAISALGAACGSGTGSGATATTSSGPTTTAAPVARTDAAGTVWLCRPGLAADPCAGDLDTTAVPAHGARTVSRPRPAASPRADCFFVYPTVSTQRAANANLKVQPAEVAVAVTEAAQFSQVCRVWAPMYHQRTLVSLEAGLGADPTADATAYASLAAGFEYYLHHFNDGRPIVFVGHSQGAAMLIRLLQAVVDPNPTLRAQTLMAVILGGNVTVPTGQLVGGSFAHLPLCHARGQRGCVIAYSSFPSAPPADSLFGIPGQGVSLQSDQTATAGLQVACVNPAAPGSTAAASLAPIFPAVEQPPPSPSVSTPFVSYPDRYTAACEHSGDATWLQVTAAPGDPRPAVTEAQGPTWGYHAYDVSLALGNLVADVAAAEGSSPAG